jgi:recombination protein RecT
VANSAPARQQQSQPAPAKPANLDDARSLLDQIIEQTGTKIGAATKLIGEHLAARADVVEAVLPKPLKGESLRLIKRAVLTFNASPSLHACPPDVFIRCVIRAAELGLAIDGKLCYVVNYKGTFQVQADYKGLVAVAKRSGQIRDCKAEVVYRGDHFRYEHVNGQDILEHAPELHNPDRGPVVAAYASFILPDGSFRACVMTRAEIDKIQKMAPSKGGPWATWWEEMARKCPVRRGLKLYCDDPGMVAAMALDDEDDAAEPAAQAPPPLNGTQDLRAPRRPAEPPGPAPELPESEPPTDETDRGDANEG